MAEKSGGGVVKKLLVTGAAAAALGTGVMFYPQTAGEPQVVSQAMLEQIMDVSELSTFEAVYNGIARVMNEKRPEKVDYYVSYEAVIKAGFDFERLSVSVAETDRLIVVTIPEIRIHKVDVDITSLDYIFENTSANTATVSQQAYSACCADAEAESRSQRAIYDLAEQNAHNAVRALIDPFLRQLGSDYRLEIRQEEQS
ncbi:MAG: DUF4230 domain-containing protein [Clostridia bacterium]|nr:DUF4230 domain-containing protein [Clostridia bacterium]MBQ3077885.1 DUF4230 domain-containing protein [Clostridia bacterium]